MAERLPTAGDKVYRTTRRGALVDQRPSEMRPLDLTSDESVEAAASEVTRREGHIDLLVNSARFRLTPTGAEESSIKPIQSIFDTNPCGIGRMAPSVLPYVRNQRSGRIIPIGSLVGF